MASKTATINFKDYFEDEYNFLMSQHNRSLFICELLREYMNGGDMQNVKSSQVVKKTPEPTMEEVVEEKNEEILKRKPRKINGVTGG